MKPIRPFLFLAALATLAHAQSNKAPPAKSSQPSAAPSALLRGMPRLLAAPSWSLAQGSGSGSGTVRAALNAALTPAAALRSFHLQFGNSDHKLGRLAVLPEDRFVQLAINDSGGEDPFGGEASFAVVSRGVQKSISGVGAGQIAVPLEKGPAKHVLLLSGFEFRREAGSDANVRQLKVWLDPKLPKAVIALVDDQGADFRGIERALGSGFSGDAGLGALLSIKRSIDEAARGLNAARGNYRPYAFTIHYAWVPEELVGTPVALSGGAERGAPVATPSRFKLFTGAVPGETAKVPTDIGIQGFEFYFGNSDHHLLAVGVNSTSARRAQEIVTYQDGNRDDPLQWALQYVPFKASAKK